MFENVNYEINCKTVLTLSQIGEFLMIDSLGT